MQTKIFEVRDEATFISMLAVKIQPENPAQRYHVSRCGYRPDGTSVMITHLNGEKRASADPYYWNDRTYEVAHIYICANFDRLNDGDVIDVRAILGETVEPCASERSDL